MNLINDRVSEDAFGFRSILELGGGEPVGHTTAPPNLCVASSLSEFSLIESPLKNIMLHFWQPSAALRQLIAQTNFEDLPEYEAIIDCADLSQVILDQKNSLCRQFFRQFAEIFQAFAVISKSESLKIQLCKTAEQPCPLFHVDRLKYRLLCTLRGPGTEWLDDRAVRRKFLGRGNNRKIVRHEAVVYEVEPFQVCILKGEAFRGGYGRGVVHRSPPVPPAVGGRWYLRVDIG